MYINKSIITPSGVRMYQGMNLPVRMFGLISSLYLRTEDINVYLLIRKYVSLNSKRFCHEKTKQYNTVILPLVGENKNNYSIFNKIMSLVLQFCLTYGFDLF